MSGGMTDRKAWLPYHLGKRVLWSGVLLFLPATALISIGLASLGAPRAVAAIVAIVWLGLWAANAFWLARFRCPACRKLFFIYGPLGIGNVWARRCCHCGAVPARDAA